MKVIPAPCLTMNESVSLRKAVQQMNEAKVDYALLQDKNNKLTGILTESDLLIKLIDIVEKNLLDQPVAKIMTTPVATLPVHLYHTAPEFFKIHNVQHAPITNHNAETGRDEIVGIITSDAIMHAMASARGLPYLYALGSLEVKRRSLAIASPDGSLWQLIEKVYEPAEKIDVERVRFANLQTKTQLMSLCEEYDAIVLDLEGAPERYWMPTVEYCASTPELEFLAVVISDNVPTAIKNELQKLQTQKVVKIYYKPLNINKLTMDLERHWAVEEG